MNRDYSLHRAGKLIGDRQPAPHGIIGFFGNAAAAGWRAAKSSAGRVISRLMSTPYHYSVYRGVSTAESVGGGFKAAFAGLLLASAILFTFWHHSAAPGVATPQSNPQGTGTNGTLTFNTTGTTYQPVNIPANETNTSADNNRAAPQSSPVAATAPSPARTPASAIGGLGGGSDPGLQPSDPASPTPSPQPSTDIPGITSPYPVTVPGESVQDGSGKQIASTSPVTITLN